MRAPALLVLTALSLGAAACASTGPAPTTAAAEASSSPAPVEGYDWFFHQDADNARLAYGLAESDDLRIGLDCARASGRLELSATAAHGAKPEIHLEAGGDTERFPAASEPSEIVDGVFLTAQARADEPVFLRFRRIGWLALWQGGERHAYAAHPQSAPNIERFFAFCG